MPKRNGGQRPLKLKSLKLKSLKLKTQAQDPWIKQQAASPSDNPPTIPNNVYPMTRRHTHVFVCMSDCLTVCMSVIMSRG